MEDIGPSTGPQRKLNRKQRKALREEERRKKRKQETEAFMAVLPAPKPKEKPKPRALDSAEASSRREKFNETLALVSFAFTVGSWGWSVVAPDSSMWFGSILLGLAVLAMLVAVFRVWRIPKLIGAMLVIATMLGFGVFDWHVVVKPQRGKPFKDLLVAGYHLTNDCGTRAAREPIPPWLRDQSKAWQAQVEQLITQKLDPKDLQSWRGAVILGLVTDENMTAYQCMSLNEKVAALETIIAEHYDPGLKHQEYEGPLYWLESIDGKVDISEALKNGRGRITIHEKPKPNDPNSSAVQIEGKLPN